MVVVVPPPASALQYKVDNSADFADGSFKRIAYHIQLDDEWVWVSMDAITQEADKIGLPIDWDISDSSVTGLTLLTNAAALTAYNGMTQAVGDVEFWSAYVLRAVLLRWFVVLFLVARIVCSRTILSSPLTRVDVGVALAPTSDCQATATRPSTERTTRTSPLTQATTATEASSCTPATAPRFLRTMPGANPQRCVLFVVFAWARCAHAQIRQ